MNDNNRDGTAGVEGLVERLSNAGHGGSIVPNPRLCREAATALTALIDPMSPDLDYLRMDPAAAAAARAAGGAA